MVDGLLLKGAFKCGSLVIVPLSLFGGWKWKHGVKDGGLGERAMVVGLLRQYRGDGKREVEAGG